MARELTEFGFEFARRWGRQRGVGRGRGGAGGHGREQAFSRLWLDHRRCSSGLRDKTWQLLWKSGQQPWGHSPASQLSPLSGSCRLVWSRGDGVGNCHPPHPPSSVAPWPTPCLVGSDQALLPRVGDERMRLGANTQLSQGTHRARAGRVSTGLGSTVLSDAELLNC